MSDTPAEIAARKFANDVAREIARKLEMDLGSAMWLVDLIDKRFAEQQSERIRELEQERCRAYESAAKAVRAASKACGNALAAEQANKELLDAVRNKLKGCREQDGCSDAALMPDEYCSNECAALAEALSKHGGIR